MVVIMSNLIIFDLLIGEIPAAAEVGFSFGPVSHFLTPFLTQSIEQK